MENTTLQIIKDDPYLEPFQDTYTNLHKKMNEMILQFEFQNGLDGVSSSYKEYGIHADKDNPNLYIYREWAPGAQEISIFGDFNDWNRDQHKAQKDQFGHWTCIFETPKQIQEFSKIKCQVKLVDGKVQDRIPAWINFTHQNQNKSFDGMYVKLGNYKFQHAKPKWENNGLKIYECHIGMSNIDPTVHSFTSFKNQILPMIAKHGYNVIQLMAILEHPYYGSFGYHVTNFFSVSSRFGKPNDFKELIDEAHKLNIKVVVDIVHAHAAKNINEGINEWDGTDYQYFHSGEKGIHSQWDSRIFDYSKYEILRFLLSNIRFWLEEYNVDGYRYDGVTSMLYKHHGIKYGFTGNYNEYFNDNLDEDALVYLMLANLLAKNIYPQVLLIAEDVSGFPALCRSLDDGGIGCNYRLSMAIPDMWIKFLKQIRDQDWDIEKIAYELTNRRQKQNYITYAQSHDQALVGDKTLSMWLFNSQIYTNMSLLNQETTTIFRGMAMHKMIRLVTFALGGNGYLNFMGNEFGHPEWIDFPRQGNNWSYHYCRRRWDLVKDKLLRYQYLNEFDKTMLKLDDNYQVLSSNNVYIRSKCNQDKILVFEKENLIFVFNWHPDQSYESYNIYAKTCSQVEVLWSSDDECFGGQNRVGHQRYSVQQHDENCIRFPMYIPNRTATVLLKK